MAGNVEEPLLSLYVTEWRERGYGLSSLLVMKLPTLFVILLGISQDWGYITMHKIAHICMSTFAIFITENTILLFEKEVRKLGFEHSTLGITMTKSAEKACFYATFEAL